MLLMLVVMSVIAEQTFGQVPIPKRPLGFVYNSGEADAPVQFDVYMGPLCPDSQNAFPTITQLASSYGPRTLRLRTHLFPLPYHRNAFLVAMGQHIVDSVTHQNMTYAWMQVIYDNLDTLSNTATASMSENDVKRKLAVFASKVGVSEAVFLMMINNDDIDEDTRIGWKYTCTRGVSGTPTFMLNDVLVAAEPTWTVTDWKKVIDPLLGVVREKNNNSINDDNRKPNSIKRSNTACKTGTQRCEFLPGKIECCTPGEHCIPNVGCRC